MATRSNTAFYSIGNDTPEAVVYRHWDGAPEGAGADLIQFLKEVPLRHWRDPAYLSSHYVVWLADKFRESNDLMDFLSVGIINDPEGYGCDYRYQVWMDNAFSVDEIRVVCYDYNDQVAMEVTLNASENIYKEASNV